MSSVPVTSAVVLYQGIRDILLSARTQVRQAVTTTMVQAYWQIGRLFVEYEQGERRAEYGKRVLPELAKRLAAEFGKGFSGTNLKIFRQFYLFFLIGHTLCDQLFNLVAFLYLTAGRSPCSKGLNP
jgi:hypothetical protein